MAYSVQAFADSSTSTFTDEIYPLGTIRFETESEVDAGDESLVGPRVLVFIKAGAAISAGELVEKNAAGTTYVGKPSAASANTHPYKLLGVAVVDIALNSYGWVVKQGECAVSALALTAGDTIGSCGTEGSVDTDATFTAIGRALATLASPGTVDAYINIP